MTDRSYPPQWGRVRAAHIFRPDTDRWEMPCWSALTFPSPEGDYHHGSCGCTPPDTAVLLLDEVPVALLDCDHISLDNLYVYDSEYYQFLRLRAVLDVGLWSQTPWAGFLPGQLIYAWDKFHGIDYDRADEDGPAFSYGGDWDDLEQQVFGKHPHDHPAPPLDNQAPPSIHLLCQVVRSGDVARLERMLAAGADPGGDTAPVPHPGVSIPFSVGRTETPLWVSVQEGTPQTTALLLRHGAPVDARPPDGMTALHGAIMSRRVAHVPLLLAAGADPEARWKGQTARQLAADRAPAIAALLVR